MKNVKDLLKEQLIWHPVADKGRFVTDGYSTEECYLQMNDFPDEPLWTLTYKEERIDLDDTPRRWKINYRSEIRKGYRNPKADFSIDSDVEQFNFSLSHTHLEIYFDWLDSEKMASVERANFYLEDGRVLKNVFIVAKKLIYYYEKEWYYNGDIRDDAPVPEANILKRFSFKAEDVLLIESDNTPQPASIDWAYLFAFFKPNRLDSTKSIEKNIFIKIAYWDQLPVSSDLIYRRAGNK